MKDKKNIFLISLLVIIIVIILILLIVVIPGFTRKTPTIDVTVREEAENIAKNTVVESSNVTETRPIIPGMDTEQNNTNESGEIPPSTDEHPNTTPENNSESQNVNSRPNIPTNNNSENKNENTKPSIPTSNNSENTSTNTNPSNTTGGNITPPNANTAPVIQTITYLSKTTNSITVTAKATDAQNDALTYIIYVSNNASDWEAQSSSNSVASGTSVTLTASNLNEYTEYYIKIRAVETASR